MGGYWTTAEIKMKLDELVASDANDVVANKIDTLGTTHQGRPIWGLRLGKTVVGPDTRPVAFFNALTHAREPGGMQALFYFVDDLLSSYGTDPFATYLLDQRVIYIVPLVNPDGYDVNEDTYVGSGRFGFWRKNTRDNNGNGLRRRRRRRPQSQLRLPMGLQRHRLEPAPDSELYRGPAAFSEPETQAQRDLVIALQPTTGISFHTYGDLHDPPVGLDHDAGAGHVDAFQEWSDEMTRDNAYISGAAADPLPGERRVQRLVLRRHALEAALVQLDARDRPRGRRLLAAAFRIVPLAQENLRTCYVVAAIAGPFVQEDGVEILEGAMNAGHLAHLTCGRATSARRQRRAGAHGHADGARRRGPRAERHRELPDPRPAPERRSRQRVPSRVTTR